MRKTKPDKCPESGTRTNTDYVPYGPEWESYCMRLTKDRIIKMWREVCIERDRLQKLRSPGNLAAMREALEALVAHLEKEIARAKKCSNCKYNGKSFRGEPCYWHVDCGLDENDIKACERAEELLIKFNLRAALAKPPRNCDIYLTEDAVTDFLVKSDCCDRCGLMDLEVHCVFCLVRWLLATKDECPKGTNHGK